MTKALSKFARSVCCRKADRGFLLKIKPAVHRTAGIDQQSQLQRQIGFPAEIHDRLRRLVIVENGEIALVQIAHELAMMVGGDEQNVDFIDPLLDGKDGVGGSDPVLAMHRAGHAGRGCHKGRLRPRRQARPSASDQTRPGTETTSCSSFPANPNFSRLTTANGFAQSIRCTYRAESRCHALRLLLLMSDSRGLSAASAKLQKEHTFGH